MRATGLDRFLTRARVGLTRLQPQEVHEAVRNGAILVDIRPEFQRRAGHWCEPRCRTRHRPLPLVPFWEQSLHQWDAMFTAGVRGHLTASRLAVPLMMTRRCGLIGAYAFAREDVRVSLAAWKPVWVLETLLIVAFGISWFAKGREPSGTTAGRPFEPATVGIPGAEMFRR